VVRHCVKRGFSIYIIKTEKPSVPSLPVGVAAVEKLSVTVPVIFLKMSLAQAEADCLLKERRFLRLTRRYEPNGFDAEVILDKGATWTKEIETALDILIDAVESMKLIHGEAIGETKINAFNNKINFGEETLRNIINQYSRKARTTASQASSINQSQASISISAFDVKKAQVNVDTDSVAREAVFLEKEPKKYVDPGEMEIEEYIGKVDDLNRRMVKIIEKAEAIKRNTKFFDSNNKLASSLSVKALLECQLEMVIENLKDEEMEDETYSENGGSNDDVYDAITDTDASGDDEYADETSVSTDFGSVDDLSHPGGDQTGHENDETGDDDTTVPTADLACDEEQAASVSTILRLFVLLG